MKKQTETKSIITEKLSENQSETDELKIVQEAIEALYHQENFFNEMIDNVGSPVFLKDDQSRILIANKAFCSIFNLSKEMVLGKTLAEHVPENERAHFFKVDQQVLANGIKHVCEETLTIKDSPPRTLITTKTRYTDTLGKHYLIGVITDITERKTLEQQLSRKANIDYLTGINNRGYFMELAELELNRSNRHNHPLALLMMDIDYFKQINDSYGHKAGDIVLKKLVDVCKRNLRDIDILGRVGGEEFAILLPETGIEEAMEVAERVKVSVENLKVPIESNGFLVQLTVSIGITSIQLKDCNLDKLLMLADNALYDAKKAGRNKICVSFK
jgi:diguanylate cyclase (GGDEF)-like protein/PAS domain S-box-containing protein